MARNTFDAGGAPGETTGTPPAADTLQTAVPPAEPEAPMVTADLAGAGAEPGAVPDVVAPPSVSAPPSAPVPAAPPTPPEPGAPPAPPSAPPGTAVEATPAGRFLQWAAWVIVVLFWVATFVFAVLALGTTLGSGGGDGGTDWPARFWAFTFGFGCVAAGLTVLQVLGGATGYGILRPLIGTDQRFSTSLTQLGLWTAVVLTVFAYLLGRVVFEDQQYTAVIPGERWDEYLLLLGGPFAAAVLAKGITTYKVQEGTLQKSEAAAPAPSQLVTSDQGSADLVDAQYLLFNIVAIGYVIARLAATNTLPEIPSPLLAVTGATAATYVANKAAARNAPTITSLSPTSAYPGDEVIVFGGNFDPADHRDDARRITITLSGVTQRLYTTNSTDSKVVFRVPGDAPAGHQTVTITSTGGVDTSPAALQVLARTPTITGLAPGATIRPGGTVSIVGLHLGAPGERLAVSFGTLVTEGVVSSDGSRLDARVPDALTAPADGTVEVTFQPAGLTQAKAILPVEVPVIRHAVRTTANTITVVTTGLGPDASADTARFTINGKPADAARTASGHTVTVPTGVDPDAELRLVVVDDLYRSSQPYDLPATA